MRSNNVNSRIFHDANQPFSNSNEQNRIFDELKKKLEQKTIDELIQNLYEYLKCDPAMMSSKTFYEMFKQANLAVNELNRRNVFSDSEFSWIGYGMAYKNRIPCKRNYYNESKYWSTAAQEEIELNARKLFIKSIAKYDYIKISDLLVPGSQTMFLAEDNSLSVWGSRAICITLYQKFNGYKDVLPLVFGWNSGKPINKEMVKETIYKLFQMDFKPGDKIFEAFGSGFTIDDVD